MMNLINSFYIVGLIAAICNCVYIIKIRGDYKRRNPYILNMIFWIIGLLLINFYERTIIDKLNLDASSFGFYFFMIICTMFTSSIVITAHLDKTRRK